MHAPLILRETQYVSAGTQTACNPGRRYPPEPQRLQAGKACEGRSQGLRSLQLQVVVTASKRGIVRWGRGRCHKNKNRDPAD